MPVYKKYQPSHKVKTLHLPIVQPASPAEKKTFLHRLLAAFKRKEKKGDPSLLGRIRELDSYANQFYQQLKNIRDELQGSDQESSTFVEAIIEPLLKELPRITKELHSSQFAMQAKSFTAYGQWLDRAQGWVQFYRKSQSSQELVDAVVHHLVGETLHLIDRDVQVIQAYESDRLSSLQLSQERLEQLKGKLGDQLAMPVGQLRNLKQRPAMISLGELSRWKGLIDQQRQLFFEQTLQLIDLFIDREAPAQSSPEAIEQRHETLGEIYYLEREASELLAQIHAIDGGGQRVHDHLLSHLAALEEQAKQLQLNTRLEWELVSRLQHICGLLAHGRRLLEQPPAQESEDVAPPSF